MQKGTTLAKTSIFKWFGLLESKLAISAVRSIGGASLDVGAALDVRRFVSVRVDDQKSRRSLGRVVQLGRHVLPVLRVARCREYL